MKLRLLSGLKLCLLFLLLPFIQGKLGAQTDCFNIGFEEGDFQTWTGYTGFAGENNWTEGFSSTRHVIISSPGTDPNTNGVLSLLNPFGGQFSMRLGNQDSGGQAEAIERQFSVTAEESSILLYYAVVFEDPSHSASEQPKFQLQILDQNNVAIEGPCFTYRVTAASNIPGFQSAGNDIVFRDWTPVAIDLSPYIGQTITIRLSTEDCTLGGHFGYAYFDAQCGQLGVNAYNCGNDGIILTSPQGFSSFQWSTGETSSYVSIPEPVEGQTYSLVASTEAGCQITMNYIMTADPIFSDPPQPSAAYCNAEGFLTMTGPNGFGGYLWSNGSTEQSTTYFLQEPGDTILVQLFDGPYCDSSIVFVVQEYTINPQAASYINRVICDGVQNIELTFNQNYPNVLWEDGTVGYTYLYENVIDGDSVSVFAVPASGCPTEYTYLIDLQTPTGPDFLNHYMCIHDTVSTIEAIDGFSQYSWMESGSTSQIETIQNVQLNDTISVILISPPSSVSCGSIVSYVINNFEILYPDSTFDSYLYCPTDQSITLFGDDNIQSYQWQDTLTFTPEYIHDFENQYSTAEVEQTDFNGCKYLKLFEFTEYGIPKDTTIIVGAFCKTSGDVELIAPGYFTDYQWYANGEETEDKQSVWYYSNPKVGDQIQISFIDSFGCFRKFSTILETNNMSGELGKTEIPNVFSPLSVDGLNDNFLVPFDTYESFSMQIFNRWGKMIFETSGTYEPILWNGQIDGSQPISGTYYYNLVVSACSRPEQYQFKGTVHLIGD